MAWGLEVPAEVLAEEALAEVPAEVSVAQVVPRRFPASEGLPSAGRVPVLPAVPLPLAEALPLVEVLPLAEALVEGLPLAEALVEGLPLAEALLLVEVVEALPPPALPLLSRELAYRQDLGPWDRLAVRRCGFRGRCSAGLGPGTGPGLEPTSGCRT